MSGVRCRLAYGPADATAHSLSLASVKSRLVLPFWYWLTWVVPYKGPLIHTGVCVFWSLACNTCKHCVYCTSVHGCRSPAEIWCGAVSLQYVCSWKMVRQMPLVPSALSRPSVRWMMWSVMISTTASNVCTPRTAWHRQTSALCRRVLARCCAAQTHCRCATSSLVSTTSTTTMTTCCLSTDSQKLPFILEGLNLLMLTLVQS